MPRRCNDNSGHEDPPRKKVCNNSLLDVQPKEFFIDISGKQWRLGKPVGVGGFGEIYLASDNLSREVKTDSNYVAKVERHQNGPLFVEVNCYLRIAKSAMIDTWKRQKKISVLGMPHYVASGSHFHKGERFRFLILPRFECDLERVLQEKEKFNLKTVLMIASQIIDVLEYIHSKGYIHADIKASNILLTKLQHSTPKIEHKIRRAMSNPVRQCRIRKRPRHLRPGNVATYVDNFLEFDELCAAAEGYDVEESRDQVYLLDYGLACKFVKSSGEHKPFCFDERKAHAGTILFCSRDAHKGLQSRRSDLESLGYNMIYWLTGNLPWINNVDHTEIVERKKQQFMNNTEYYLQKYVGEYSTYLQDYFNYLQKLKFQDKPDYDFCKNLFKKCLKVSGYKDDACFDFDNVQKCKLPKTANNFHKFVSDLSRRPLQSNIPVYKPSLRKKIKNKLGKQSNWFETLIDPETLLRKREKKHETDYIPSVADMDIDRLNPTYAMIEIYNKCREGPDAPRRGFVENIQGYTPAMMAVLRKIKKAREREQKQVSVTLHKVGAKTHNRRIKKLESPSRLKSEKENLVTRKAKTCTLRRFYSLRG